MTDTDLFYDLANKVASGAASAEEQSELKSRMEKDAKLNARYERIRKDYTLVRNILPLLEAAEAPEQEIPASVLARLQGKIREDSGGTKQESNQVRGRWGEETLRRVIEAAGMSSHCDFIEQDQAGNSRPDLAVRLPGERQIIVVVREPDPDVLSGVETANPAKRAELLAMYAAKIKTIIKSLADCDYPNQVPYALDHVVLFLPAESLLSAALEGDRELIVWAIQYRILLATPASLIALLRSVSVSWQQHAQIENAQKLGEAARDLYTQVAKFFEHLKEIRSGPKAATSALNDAVEIYDRLVRPSGERLFKLGTGASSKELAELQPVENALHFLVFGRK